MGKNRGEIVTACALAIAFAVFTCFVSMNIEPRFLHRGETIRQQMAILAGQDFELNGVPTYFGSLQNRVLFPLALKAVSSVGQPLSMSQWYLALRLTTAVGAALLVWWLLRSQAGARPKLAAVGLGVLAYEMVFTFNHGWEHPTDFPDVALTTLWLWAVLKRRHWAAVAVAAVGALNRESAAFAGVVWVVLYGVTERFRLRLPEVAFGTFLSGAAYACVLAARWVFGGARAFQVNTNASDIPETPQRFWEDHAAALRGGLRRSACQSPAPSGGESERQRRAHHERRSLPERTSRLRSDWHVWDLRLSHPDRHATTGRPGRRARADGRVPAPPRPRWDGPGDRGRPRRDARRSRPQPTGHHRPVAIG
jgi:hypothetical protein